MPPMFTDIIPLTTTTKRIRSSDYEQVRDIDHRHTQWLDADEDNRTRMYEAISAFVDVNGGAWRETDRARLIREGRHPVSFNIAEQKLYSLAGSIRSEKWDFDYIPVVAEKNTLINNIKYWYYKDKEQYNYSQSADKTLTRGLLHAGYEGMDIRYDIRPEGAIVFFSYLPGQILEDPWWQSDDYRDWNRAMIRAWLTPEEIVKKYDTNDFDIKNAVKTHSGMNETYEPIDGVRTFEDSPETWGSKYLVIEYRWIETEKTTRLYLRSNGKFIPLPVKIKDESEVRNLMEMHGVESWEDVMEFPYINSVMKFTTVVPSLSNIAILSSGNHPIQCGSIGIFPFSSVRESGVKKGVFEGLLDVQRTINYREMKKDDIIASSASGALAVDVTRLPNGDRDLDKIKQNKTRPDAVFGVEGNPNQIFAKVPYGEVPNDIINDLSALIDMMDRVTPVTPALEGRATPNESGVAFEMRHAVTRLGTLILYENWRQHEMNKAEAWYNQAQITYKGMYRDDILNTDTNETIEFNAPEYRDGKRFILNGVEELPRANVIVTLRRESPTLKMARQAELMEQTKILAANPQLFKNQSRILINDLISLTDRNPEEKAKINRLNQLEELRDILEVWAQIENIKGAGIQAKVMQEQAIAMLQQLSQGTQGLAQAGAQTPQLGGGGSAEQVPEALSEAPAETPLPEEESTEPGAPIQTIRGEFTP